MSGLRLLAVVRHAPTAAAGLCIGRTDIEPTTPHPEAATLVAARLAAMPELCLTHLWSSPLRRCSGLAEALSARWSLPLGLDARLAEIDLGAFEGRSFTELERDEPEAMAAWMNSWEHQGPPGGEGARAVGVRAGAWLDALPSGGHLLIAHAGVARALRVRLGGELWGDAMARQVPYLELDALYRW
ncbi:MAG: histidine phosphatase family protein [Polyangiaceae bacterium]|nr:histidine phosphatase family protein [Polyangiaceae bacterium]